MYYNSHNSIAFHGFQPTALAKNGHFSFFNGSGVFFLSDLADFFTKWLGLTH